MTTLADQQIEAARLFIEERKAAFQDFVDHEEHRFEIVDVDGDVVLWKVYDAEGFTSTQLEVLPPEASDLVSVGLCSGSVRALFITQL